MSAWLDALTKGRDLESPAELYHENSKRRRGLADPATQESAPRQPLVFPGYPRHELGEPAAPTPDAAIARTGPLTCAELSALLAGAGFLDTMPAALETYLHAAAIEGLPDGLYHYDPVARALTLLAAGEAASLVATLMRPESVAGAAATIVLAGRFEAMAERHGERGYRLALMTAGRVMARLETVAAALGLAAIASDAFYDRELDEALDLDGVTVGTLALVTVAPRRATDGADGG